MENEKWYKMVKAIYISVLRPLVVEKVKNSASNIDDLVLEMLDKIFDYES
jgi:hypothetical protein